VFGVVAPVGVKVKLFVRLMVRYCPEGTVITTGDQVPTVAVPAATALFNATHVAVAPVTAVPQL